MCQLLLGKRKKKIGLIFAAVGATQQQTPTTVRMSRDARIVPRGNVICSLLFGPFEQCAEFEIPVAGNARVGRAPAEVILCEWPDHRLGKFTAQIDQRMRYA